MFYTGNQSAVYLKFIHVKIQSGKSPGLLTIFTWTRTTLISSALIYVCYHIIIIQVSYSTLCCHTVIKHFGSSNSDLWPSPHCTTYNHAHIIPHFFIFNSFECTSYSFQCPFILNSYSFSFDIYTEGLKLNNCQLYFMRLGK